MTGNSYFVDPINGNDLTANGSGRSGAAAAPGCAFKTITRAMQVIPATPPVGTKIILVGQPVGPDRPGGRRRPSDHPAPEHHPDDDGRPDHHHLGDHRSEQPRRLPPP